MVHRRSHFNRRTQRPIRKKHNIRRERYVFIVIIVVLAGLLVATNYDTVTDVPLISQISKTLAYFGLGSDYSVDVTGIEDDTIEVFGGTKYVDTDVSRVTVVITNNKAESSELKFKRNGIVYNDGSQVGVYTGGFFDASVRDDFTDRYFDSLDTEYYGFTLLPHGKDTFYFAYSRIDMSKDPKLVLSFIENDDNDKEFTIDLKGK